MTPKIHTRAALAAAVAAALAMAAPAQSMPLDLRSPDARDAGAAQQAFGGSYRPVEPKTGLDHRAIEAALAQEAYYSSHKPVDAESGLDAETQYSGDDVRTVDARDAANAPDGAVTRVTAPATPAPPSSSDFEWGDAAIGAGSAVGLVLVLAGGVAVISRRRTPATQ
jgi:hypothetical protein